MITQTFTTKGVRDDGINNSSSVRVGVHSGNSNLYQGERGVTMNLKQLDGKPLGEYIRLAQKCKSNCREMLMKIEAGEML